MPARVRSPHLPYRKRESQGRGWWDMSVIFHAKSLTVEVLGPRGFTLLECTEQQFSTLIRKNRHRIAYARIDLES